MDAPPVQYVKTSDGHDIAYAISGTGTPMICLPVGFSDVETRWRHYPRWMEGLAARFQAITYDNRGTGLSTRASPADLTGVGFDRDLAAVIEALRLEKPILLAGAISAGHSAVRYAVANPDRVQALIWNTASVTSAAWPGALFGQLARENRDLFLSSLARGLPESEQKVRVHEYGNWITPEAWDKRQEVVGRSSVEAILPQLRVPTLILHPAGYPTVPQEESRKVAALIPSARFVSTSGITLFGDAEPGLAAIDAFLRDLPEREPASARTSDNKLSAREAQVLTLLAAGKSNQQIADELVISLNTVNRHVSNIYAKTGAANRAQATAYAKDHGLA